MGDNVRNKIIAISGQPVTGKGTSVKKIIDKLKSQGYTDKDIHIISTGHEFRKCFDSISNFIKNYDKNDDIEEILRDPYLKKFIERNEYRDILIRTIAKLKQSNIDISNITIEQANNLEEFSELRKIVDTIIDTEIEKKGKEINFISRPDEVWIIDSRLAFHNIPDAFSVRLISDSKVAAERLFNDETRGKEDKYLNVEEALEAREKRRIGEQERYKERYGVDLEDETNYDLIIDTSYSTVEDVSDTILTCLDCYINNEPFSKNWTSPKVLLPLQGERFTYGETEKGYDLERLSKEIKKNGYNPDEAIEIIETDSGYKCIIDGHHRNFGAAYAGKTLVPYKVLARGNETVPGYAGIANNREKYLRRAYLWGHEGFFDKPNERFSYDYIYPEIHKILKERGDDGR